MSKGIQAKQKKIKQEFIDLIKPILCEHCGVGEDECMGAANKLIFPVVYDDGEEAYITITLSTPNGTRMIDDEGNPYFEPYDGEAEIANYRADCERAAKTAAEKAAKEAQKKMVKSTLKTMKKDLAEVLPSQVKGS